MTINVLFVCLGNICRSPTAEGVFQKCVNDAGLDKLIRVDSGGTAGWHEGRTPDIRTIAVAKKRGYDLSQLHARQISKSDFENFDYILAMDSENLRNLELLKLQKFSGYLGLFLTFSEQQKFTEVPDPYHGGASDFELVLDLVEDASSGLLNFIRNAHNI